MNVTAKHNLSDVPTKEGLTVIVHPDDIEVVNDRPDVRTITAEDTLAIAAKFKASTWAKAKADPDFLSRFKMVFPDMDIASDTREMLQDFPIGVRHVVGLIICTNMALNQGKFPYWAYPETYLHPRSQSGIAQLAISYTKWLEEAAAQAKAAKALEDQPPPPKTYGDY